MPDATPPPLDSAALQARLAGILEAALDCIVTVDHTGRFLDFNPAAERTFGYTRAAVLGREMTDLIVPPQHRDHHRSGMARVFAGGTPKMLGRRIEITAMRADGSEFPVELAITQLAGEGPPLFTAHLRDITERKHTEAELLALKTDLEQRIAERTAALARTTAALEASAVSQRESQTSFERSFHSSPAIMSISRVADGRFIEVNPAFLRTSGLPREAVIGRTALDLGLWTHLAERDEFFRRIRSDRLVRDFTADFHQASGEPFALLLNADLIEVGGQPCILSVGIDVTERRRRDLVQTGIYEISRAVLSGADLPTLLGQVHGIIGRLMPAKNFYVALINADRSVISFPYFVDEQMPPIAPRPPRNGITEYIIDTGRPLLAGDAEILALLHTRPGPVPSGHETAQWLGAPLLIDGRGIGALVVQDYHNPAAYTEEDQRLLVFVADQAAAAVHRQQVEAAQREARTYFEKSFHSSPALMVINRVSDRVITEANPAFLRACDFTREEVIGRTPEEIDLWVNPDQRDRFLQSLREHENVRDLEADFHSKSGATTTFLINADVLDLGGTPSVLSVGIDISDRRRRDRVQAATYAISQAALAGGDLPALFAELHRIIDGLLGAKNFYVALLNADRSLLSFPYFVDESAAAPAPRQPGAGLTEYVINTARPLRTTADGLTVILRGDSRYRPTGKPSALWLGAPLMIDGRAIGVITVQDYHNPAAYSEADLQLLMFVADQAAIAVHRRQVEATQREARAYFEKSFHSSSAHMSIARIADGAILEINPSFLRGSGYTREEVIGKTTVDLRVWLHPAERDEFIHRIRTTGIIRDFATEFRSKTGAIRTLILNADLIELNGATCILTVGIDITERRRDQVQAATYAISQLALGDADLPTLFAGVHRIIATLMPAQNLYVALVSDDGTLHTFPYFVDAHVPPPEPRAPQNGFTEYVLASGHPVLTTAPELAAVLRARGPYQPLDRPAAQRLGAPLLIAGRAIGVIALQDYDNSAAYGPDDAQLLGFVAEQTAATIQRHRAEAARARAEANYRSIFENALEGLYLSSVDGRFLRVNPALARMCGYASPAAMMSAMNDIGRQLYAHPGRRAEFFESISATDTVTDFDSEIVRADGTTFWISESVRVVRTAGDDIDHFEGVAIDITQRREAARVLQAAKDAADTASRSKSRFLASVSHELRTPLNGILGYTQILRRDLALGEKQRDGVRVIHESADHLLALINDILDLSKVEAGRLELHPTDFDLSSFAAGAERIFTPRARKKNLLLETALAPELPRFVHGDEQRLRQVVFNVLANAVKFTTNGGVVFSIQRVEGPGLRSGMGVPPMSDDRGATGVPPVFPLLRFSVSDTGPGIADADLERIFEPFTQVGDSARSATGTGLGLAISRSLVEHLGGSLHVESRLGWGSRFWFDLALPTARADALPDSGHTSRRVLSYEGPRRRILVVDDNATNRAVMVNLLAPLGFALTEAVDGAAAVTQAAAFQPDLILMDLRLPGGMDGLEATRRIRATPLGAALRIIAVSASAYDLDRNKCFTAGCDAFLAKPFREEELWSVVKRALGLAWNYSDPEETRSPFPHVIHAPPAAEAAAFYELAAKGDVVGIRARAQALVASDPQLAPFAQVVLDLAARFKMKTIRQFVARYLPEK